MISSAIYGTWSESTLFAIYLAVLETVTGNEIDYHHKPKYWDTRGMSSVDPDQMPQNEASDQGLYCLPLIQHYFRHINR